MHHPEDLIRLFNDCFYKTFNTQLMKGGDEPLYLPASGHQAHHVLYFAHGFFSSALHECAHWLIAGDERRQQVDFGYWYAPDGRTSEQQTLFQRVEVKPQALEWILAEAAGYPFQVSLDNLNGVPCDEASFKAAVHAEVKHYCERGLATRAALFRQTLCDFYERDVLLNPAHFDLGSL